MTRISKEMFYGIDAVIFDMDGTLIDSMWVWSAVDKEFYKKYDLKEPGEEFYYAMEGKSYTEVARYFLDYFPTLSLSMDEIMKEWTVMAYEKYTTQVPLKEGVREFLSGLRSASIKLGVATSNGRELVDGTLSALGIANCFDSVRTACEVKQGKPSPDIYLLVAEDLGIAPDRCLVFEDVPMGILAGKSAGMRVCAIADEASRAQEPQKQKMADYYIENFTVINASGFLQSTNHMEIQS